MAHERNLTREQAKVLAYLRNAWAAPLKAMTVAQAAERIRLPLSDDDRRTIFLYLGDHPQQLGRYVALGLDPLVFVLTNVEKLVARFLLLYERQTGKMPFYLVMARALGIDRAEAARAVEFLWRVGLLRPRDRKESLSGYRISEACRHAFRRGVFFFHTVTVDSRETFNVP